MKILTYVQHNLAWKRIKELKYKLTNNHVQKDSGGRRQRDGTLHGHQHIRGGHSVFSTMSKVYQCFAEGTCQSTINATLLLWIADSAFHFTCI